MNRFYAIVLTALAVLLLPITPARGLMSDYQFSVSTGSANSMSGASQAHGTAVDDNVAAGLSIGFTFKFDGTDYTTFSVGSNGQMGLGSTAIQGSFTNTLTPSSTYPIIAAFYDDLHTGTDGSVTYVTSGSSPNRVLTVNWNIKQYPGGSAYTTNFQTRLYEGSNKIEFWYGTNNGATSWTASVGAAASSSNYASITTTSGANTVSYTSVNNSSSTFPSSGTMYTLSPCASTVTIAGNIAQGGTATMASGATLFSGYQVQRGNNAAYQPFTITNPSNACGTRTYTYSLSGINAADYQLSTTTGSLTATQTNTPTITFTPSGTGTRTATLTVRDDGGFNRSYTLAAQGSTRIQWVGNIAQGGTPGVPNGDTLMMNSEVRRLLSGDFTPITITNFNTNPAAPAAPVSVTLSDPSGQFSLVPPTTASLTANQSYSPIIRFSPYRVGFQNATLTVVADGETRVYPLKAYSVAPGGEFFLGGAPLAADRPIFSNQFSCVGEVANTQEITIVNTGRGDFTINSFDVYKTDTMYGQGTPRYPISRDRFGNPIRMYDYFITTQPGVAPSSANQMIQLPYTIPQGQSRKVYLTFVGQENGKRFGRVFVNTNGETFNGFDIDGTERLGLLVADLFGIGVSGRLSDNANGGPIKTLSFEPIRVGDSLDMTYRFFNTGDCDLRISLDKLLISSGDIQDFRLLDAFGRTVVPGVPMTGSTSLAPDESGTISIRFKPSRNGSRRATLWIQTSDSSTVVDGITERGAYYLDLYGFGKAFLDFSNLKLRPAVIGAGVPSRGSVRVVNASTASIGIESITLVDGNAAEFSEDATGGAWPATPFTMIPGAELQLGVQMNPTGDPGARATTLRIVTTSGETINIAITGEAGSQGLSVSTNRMFVGTVIIAGTEQRQSVMIRNTGTLPLTLNTPTITGPGAGDYRLGALPRRVIEPNGVEYLEVTYSPTNAGVSTAVLTISSDAGTQVITLEGEASRTKSTDPDPTAIIPGRGRLDQPEIGITMNSTSSVRDAAAAAAGIAFDVVRPNPARERAELVYRLGSNMDVRLELYDATGRLVRQLASGSRSAGEHRVVVDVSELGAGVYHCRLVTGSVELSRNVVVVK